MRSVCSAAVAVRELLLQGRDVGVRQPRGGRQIAFALRLLDLALQDVELLLELADAVEARLLLLPARGQRRELGRAVGHVAAQLREALLRGDVGLALERELLHAHPVHGALQLVDLDRPAVDLHAQAGRGLVDEVDGLVGQEARRDVAVRQQRRGDERGVGDVDLVVALVAALEPAQDRHGVLDGRLADQHLLEAPLERRRPSRCRCGTRRASSRRPCAARRGEHRLEHVAGVHRALGLAGADERVQLVEEGDDLALALLDLLEHGLEPLLELPAVLRAGDHAARSSATMLLPRSDSGRRPRRCAERDPRRRRSSRRRLTDEHGVVLRAPAEHLDDAADLVVAADDRVELAARARSVRSTPYFSRAL
jgi:hypothetical protein